ncbi:phosphate acetyltransferase [Candidatus Gracilibacteria bacterium]|nr:phosphate acetyltransferase [Candidatus Gracilibacteria bacterium]
MQKFIRKVHAIARANPQRIVLAEGEEIRVLEATAEIVKKKIAQPILIGNSRKIKAKGKKFNIDWDKVEIHDPSKSKLSKEFATKLYELRKNKGLTLRKAKTLIKDFSYFATMMVQEGHAAGMVTGTTYSTADSIRPALQIIKTEDRFHKVSGVFFMVLEKRLLLFADTAINVDPNSHELVEIANDTAKTAKKFGIVPRIAFLSFSTKGSADHPRVDKMREAYKMFKSQNPKIVCDGEIQVDAAIVPEVAKRKCPKSPLKGNANILIFPSLESANISYKLIERLAKAKAIGPLLQGLRKPVNDLSRGCSAKDIVNVTAFTATECLTNHLI